MVALHILFLCSAMKKDHVGLIGPAYKNNHSLTGINVRMFHSELEEILLRLRTSTDIIIIIIIIIILYSNTYMYTRYTMNTRHIFEKVDREVIPIKGPLTEL